MRRVVVIGGGLGGMAAAVALAGAARDPATPAAGRFAVTLLEARKLLGGRAGSFEDPRTGLELDNCQHVLLGCCTNLIDFYKRLGVGHLIRFERRIHFLDSAGRRFDLFGARGLPAPLHLGRSFASFGLLTLAERAALARAMIAMMRLGRAGRAALANVAFGDWLDAHRQPAGLIEKLYTPVLVSALNEEPRRASAACAIQVFVEGMLANSGGYVMGLPDCPLSQLYQRLDGVEMSLGMRVSGLRWSGDRVNGVYVQSGDVIDCDAVVLATNHHAVPRWIPPALAATDARFARLDQLQSVPILGAHLWFDRPVMFDSHAALVSGPLQWLFRKDAAGRAVHGVISAAREWVGAAHDECLDRFAAQIRQMLPAAREAKLVRGVVVVEKRATFSPLPGVDDLRPAQAPPEGGLANVYLAGDYTQTGWPATMEGAVRAGYLAAEALLDRFGAPQKRFLVADLPPQWPSRLLGS